MSRSKTTETLYVSLTLNTSELFEKVKIIKIVVAFKTKKTMIYCIQPEDFQISVGVTVTEFCLTVLKVRLQNSNFYRGRAAGPKM